MKRNKEMKLSIALHSAKYILTAIFIALNLLGVVHWYWVWIVSPLLMSLAIKVILCLYSASLCARCLDGLKGGIKNETIVYYEKRPKYVNWKTDGSGNALCRGILDFKDT